MKNTVILKSYKDGIAIYLDDTLEFEQLWQYPMLVMMDQSHPLAACSEIPYHSLSEYIEINIRYK